MLELISDNKEILRVFYTFIIALICALIVVKTDRLFRLSLHNGIRYVRNAFLFYGIGFIIRGFLNASFSSSIHFIMNVLFELFLIMAGFFLLYSLLWKRFEAGKNYPSSLLNPWVLVFYSMALIIAILDNLWMTYVFMFLSQIVLFSFTSIISFVNYRKNGRKHKFLKFYFIAMFLSLMAWILNAAAALFFEWHPGIMLNTYIINIIIFLLFLYGVIKFTKKN